ncbi:unnamed protein product, partial [Didymodactylos carnosus]
DSSTPPPLFERLILVVIDALREDYVFNSSISHLKYVHHLLKQKQHAIGFKIKTQTPTVTLPRLKALISGTIPGFWDILYNYNSTAIDTDNFLLQYRRKYPEKKIVFYGDDTWLKLFPNMFDRQEGTTSFFVSDFREVDENVTRHLEFEFENNRNDWSILILHYLGLDHIGHFAGSKNSYIDEKLIEMDHTLSYIYQKLKETDLLLLTGDHGMADQGGHGGASYEESHVPAVFISPQFDRYEKLLLQDESKIWLQIDLTPTLCSLFHLPVPSNNLGILIKPLIDIFFNQNMKTCLINDNQRQLSLIINKYSDDVQQDNIQALSAYDLLKKIRDKAIQTSSQQTIQQLLLGMALFWCSTIALIIIHFIEIKDFSILIHSLSIYIGSCLFIFYLLLLSDKSISSIVIHSSSFIGLYLCFEFIRNSIIVIKTLRINNRQMKNTNKTHSKQRTLTGLIEQYKQ